MAVDFTKPTLGVDEMAELLGCHFWTVYQHPDALVPVIRVGSKLRWPTAPVLRALGIEDLGVT